MSTLQKVWKPEYHHSVPRIVVHITHVIFALWIGYIGYYRIRKETIDENHYYMMALLGAVVTIYFIHLYIKNYGISWNYSFDVPHEVVHIIHIINGIVLLLVGLYALGFFDEDAKDKPHHEREIYPEDDFIQKLADYIQYNIQDNYKDIISKLVDNDPVNIYLLVGGGAAGLYHIHLLYNMLVKARVI